MKILLYTSLAFILLCTTGCRKSLSAEKKILTVGFTYSNGNRNGYTDAVLLDEANKRVVIHVDVFDNTDSNRFQLEFGVSPKAQLSVANNQVHDLSQPLKVTVTAEDGSKSDYTIVRSLARLYFWGNGVNFAGMPAFIRGFSLQTGNLRQIKATNATTEFVFGKPEPAQGGGWFYHNFSLKLQAPLSSINTNAVFDSRSQFTANVTQSFLVSQFKEPLDSGRLIITKYDPALKLCSGIVDHVTSFYPVITNGQRSFIRINGHFENMPLPGQ